MVSPRGWAPLAAGLWALGATGCGGPDADATVADPQASTVPEMSPARLLTRASLDLRGTRLTLDELAAVEADPSAVDPMMAAFMEDPRFHDRVMALFGEVYLTEADAFDQDPSAYGIDDTPAYLDAIGEEPLRIVARVVTEDLPWTEVVTADWTMANPVTAQMWPVDYPADGTGWQVSAYTDDRPAAGVLSTNGLWWRYTSTASNANRKRANSVSRILLCNDYLVRPIEFDRDVDLLDADAVNDAILYNPSCVNCHNSLDPLAGYFYGFWSYTEGSYAEAGVYHPEREYLWQDTTGVAPGYYGEPGDNLGDLGQQIAADPRFPQCVVEQVYAGLLRRDITLADSDHLTAHREALLAADMRVKALFASVLSDPWYRAAQVDGTEAVPTKLITPDQLASQVADLTGFTWTYAGYPMLATDIYGVRTLAGGVDGITVSRSARAPNATILLVQERIAEAAASAVVQADLAVGPAGARLFTEVDLADPIDTADSTEANPAVAQIQALHARIFATRVAADGEEVAANLDLLAALQDIGGAPDQAWTGLLTALMRDPDFLLY